MAVSDPAFSSKIAKLFGWTDVDGSQTSNLHHCASPGVSRSGSPTNSPISSPTTARCDGCEDRRDDGATRALQAGSGAYSGKIVVHSVSDANKEKFNGLKALDLPDVAVLGDGSNRSSSKDGRKQSSPCGTTGLAVPLIFDPSNNQGTTTAECPRCMQLHHELEMALTDRTLAEAELVSLRRAISLVDPTWETESAGGATSRQVRDRGVEPGVGESEDGDAEKTTPLSSSGIIDNDLDLHDELGWLEKLAHLGDDVAAPYIFGQAEDSLGLPMLQVGHHFP